MTRQCHCGDDGDEIVFGVCRRCQPEGVHAANLQDELDRLERDDPAVRAASAGLDALYDRLVPSWRFVVPESEPVLRDRWDMDDDERRGT